MMNAPITPATNSRIKPIAPPSKLPMLEPPDLPGVASAAPASALLPWLPKLMFTVEPAVNATPQRLSEVAVAPAAGCTSTV